MILVNTELGVSLLEAEAGVVYPSGHGVGVPPPALSKPAEPGVHLHSTQQGIFTRILVDASVLQWGQNTTHNLYLSEIPPPISG